MSPTWHSKEVEKAQIKKLQFKLIKLESEKNKITKNEKKKEPIHPDIVLFGLNFVNFFPLNNLPKVKPPMSEAKHISNVNIRKQVVFEFIKSK